MNRRFQSMDKNSVWLSILMIVLGLVLALWPGHVMTTAVTILGVALLAGGAISAISWYRGRMRGASYLTLAEGILLGVAGIFVLAAPKLLISILPVCVGIVILVNGVVNLAQALDQRRAGYPRWTVSLTLAILTVVLGLLVVFNPFSTMEMLVTAIGIVVIYNGASNLWIESRYRRF